MLMPHRIETLKDITQVFSAYTLAFVISLNEFGREFHALGEFIKYLSFALAGGYTAWKWYNESHTKRKKK